MRKSGHWKATPRSWSGYERDACKVCEGTNGELLLTAGMSAELQQNPDPQSALRFYVSTIPLVSSLTSLALSTPAYLTSTSSASAKQPFENHREVYRYLSTALCRASILSARTPNANRETLRILRSYHALTASWPSAFRPLQRQRMLQLYLRSLHSGYPPANTAPDSQYTLDPTVQGPKSAARALWQAETIDTIRQGKILLSSTTNFPRAGVLNVPVRRFADLCVALADKCANVQREVINVLWWAMSLTFQSQSILRHLTRLQAAQGDAAGARRTFELYVQIVLKAKETLQPDIVVKLKRRPSEVETSPAALTNQTLDNAEEGGGKGETPSRIADTEVDSDDEFVACLLVGAKLLWEDMGIVEEAWRYVTLAGDVVEAAEKGGRGLKQASRGEVEQYKGIVRLAMAMRGESGRVRETMSADRRR